MHTHTAAAAALKIAEKLTIGGGSRRGGFPLGDTGQEASEEQQDASVHLFCRPSGLIQWRGKAGWNLANEFAQGQPKKPAHKSGPRLCLACLVGRLFI
eukprot:scaffold169961_cov19-Tisochrysis_lutea.AAC.2